MHRGGLSAAIRPLAVLVEVLVVCCGLGVARAAAPSPASAPSEQWWPVPLVTKAVRDAGYRPGGEGGQWPQAIYIDPVDGKFLLYGTDVGGIFRSLNGGKTFEPCNRGYTPRGNGAAHDLASIEARAVSRVVRVAMAELRARRADLHADEVAFEPRLFGGMREQRDTKQHGETEEEFQFHVVEPLSMG